MRVYACGLRVSEARDLKTSDIDPAVIATGVMEEFESAKRLQRVVIPIGATVARRRRSGIKSAKN
jgi:integrase